MARTNKNYQQKKDELTSQIWDLFLENGYEHTSLAMIIEKLQISKGVFYHYFESKENCLDYAIKKYINKSIINLESILKSNNACSAEEKFKFLLQGGLSIHNKDKKNIDNVHILSNAILHQKLLVQMTKEFAPIFSEIIMQGINENSYKTDYPLEISEIILSISNFLLNSDLFNWTKDELKIRLKVLEETMTLLLHAKPDSFSYINQFI